MPSLGPMELLVIAAIALIVFGPERLPEMARKVGRAAAELRRMAEDVRGEFEEGLDVDLDEDDDGNEDDEGGEDEGGEDEDASPTAAPDEEPAPDRGEQEN